MLYISTDKEFWLLQCSDFEPKKQRFSWKKLGKDEALVLAKKARDLQVEKRKYNAQLQKAREIAEAEEEEKDRIARNAAIDAKQKQLEEQFRQELMQKELEQKSAVYKIKLPDDLDSDRKRLIMRDLFFKELRYYNMPLEKLELELPSLINHYEIIHSWDRVWLSLKA